MPFLSRAIPLEEILNRHHRFQDLMIAFLLSSLQPPLELFWAADDEVHLLLMEREIPMKSQDSLRCGDFMKEIRREPSAASIQKM